MKKYLVTKMDAKPWVKVEVEAIQIINKLDHEFILHDSLSYLFDKNFNEFDYYRYTVSEPISGARIANGDTIEEAIENFNDRMQDKTIKDLEVAILRCQKEFNKNSKHHNKTVKEGLYE